MPDEPEAIGLLALMFSLTAGVVGVPLMGWDGDEPAEARTATSGPPSVDGGPLLPLPCQLTTVPPRTSPVAQAPPAAFQCFSAISPPELKYASTAVMFGL